MRTRSIGLLVGLALAAATPGALTAAPAVAAPAPVGSGGAAADPGDDLPSPLADKQRALRQEAVADVLSGEATPRRIGSSTVVEVGREASATPAGGTLAAAAVEAEAQYVELGREDTDRLFVLLVEFGDERHPDYPDRDTDPETRGPEVFDGPRFGQIPEPDRRVDNVTDWHPDYGRAYYEDAYFGDGSVTGRESVRQFYERQSSGRYSVEGFVTDVVRVPFNEARYGRSDGFPCERNVCSNTWELIRDGMAGWVAAERAAGRTDQQIASTLAEFDVWDRYDWDGDGDFDEPDGYIDHLQVVHAGGDQADRDPRQGEDAIWSHRWVAFIGPDPQAPIPPLGGTEVGDTGIWAADYTIQPENGGLSVFVHEFGHDLGLPDLYDTSAPVGVDNPVSWWSTMAQSRVSAAEDQAVGSRAADFGPWEKLQLGWLDYEVVGPGELRRLRLGPHAFNTQEPQAAVVVLPDKQVPADLGAPFAGSRQWWSGSDDDLQATMSRQLTLPAGPAELGFRARWNIEDCEADPCDYAFVEVDDGSGWKALPGSITRPQEGNGIDGVQAEWVPARFDLSAYAGRTVGLRVRYATDGAVQGEDPDVAPGIFLDEIVVTAAGQTLVTDGAESGDGGWRLDGFTAQGSSLTLSFDQFYLASNREYLSFDRYLRTGPYDYGPPLNPRTFAEHFPYQDGLLVWYWDTSVPDNDTTVHPGSGHVLPVDAHPRVVMNLDGQPWRGRVQTYDATFGLERVDSFALRTPDGRRSLVRGEAGNPVFDDSDPERYLKPRLPSNGVRVAGTGTRIRVEREVGASVEVEVDTRTAVTP